MSLIDTGSGVFAPTAGDSFEIISSSTAISGLFSSENLPTLTGQLSWQVDYDLVGGSVTLEVLTPFTSDFDGDGDVDDNDLSVWQSSYAANDGGDTDDDLDTDGFDFLAWQREFTGDLSQQLSASTAVPEPSTVAILIGIAAIRLIRFDLGRKRPL